MEYIYVAQLEENKVVAVSMLKKKGFEQATNQVMITSLDESLLGKVYDAKTNTFTGGAQ